MGISGVSLMKVWMCVCIVFLYVFSFYIIRPVTSSMLIAAPFIFLYLISKAYQRWLREELSNPLLTKIFLFQFVLMGLCLVYTNIHLTYDYSYLKMLIGHQLHFVCGIFILIFLKNKWQVTALQIEQYIVYAYLLQSVIQLAGFASPAVASAIAAVNGDAEFQEMTGGVRGLALSSSTGWSVALTYGLVYIIYVKRYLLGKVTAGYVCMGVILLTGTFFAGRTGFVGAGVGALYFLLNPKRQFFSKCIFTIKILSLVFIFCLSFYLIFPGYTELLVEKVFPFAFEPFYKLYYNDQFSTGSTDQLAEMWEVPISLNEILFGTGYFTDPLSDAYYKKVDIGILRNLFYWGIGGYMLVILYQLLVIRYIRGVGTGKSAADMLLYRRMILLFLILMEFKAVAIGVHKMAFSILFMLAYFYSGERRSAR